MRLTSLDDVGQLITTDWLTKKIRFYKAVEKVQLSFLVLSALTFLLFVLTDSQEPKEPNFPIVTSFVVFIAIWLLAIAFEQICSFFWGYSKRELNDMPPEDCLIVLNAIENFESFHFLKGRIANMDRKLTIMESDFIKKQLVQLESNLSHDACRTLYGM